MKMLTVRQVARVSGVSVRTLHHYDQIGLLKPARTGANRYRYYGEEELLRLQQILIHRELDIPLNEIAAILDAPGFDRLAALRLQREKLEAKAQRYARLATTIDRTIARIEGDGTMPNADLYAGISPEKQSEYEAWLTQKYGGDMGRRIETSRKKFAALSEAEKQELQDELRTLEAEWVAAMEAGVPAGSPALHPLVGRFQEWVAFMWGRPCPPEAFSGLADLHLSHPDFVGRYEALCRGFSDYHAAAMKAYAGRCQS